MSADRTSTTRNWFVYGIAIGVSAGLNAGAP